ncbi:MAG: DUF2058 domain-containing protein [Xanthomonadales bacterium]|nr:DUF2058 domain-containing protein [Xanthomonadales bacterium]
MTESLRDQLLKAGLAKPKVARKQPTRQHRKPVNKKPVNKKPREVSDLAQAWQARAKDEKDSAKKRSGLKQAEQKRRREINNKIVRLLDSGKQNKDTADISRNFSHFGKIRKIMVDKPQLEQLNSGSLGVIYLRGRYYLVDAAIAVEVKKMSPQHVPDLQGSENPEESDHPVPDDLIW